MVWACPAVPIRDRLTFVVLRQGRFASLRDRLLGEATLDPAPRTLGRLQIGAVGEGLDASGFVGCWAWRTPGSCASCSFGGRRFRGARDRAGDLAPARVRPAGGGCWGARDGAGGLGVGWVRLAGGGCGGASAVPGTWHRLQFVRRAAVLWCKGGAGGLVPARVRSAGAVGGLFYAFCRSARVG